MKGVEEDECHSWTGSDTYHSLWFIGKNMNHHLKQGERARKCSLGDSHFPAIRVSCGREIIHI